MLASSLALLLLFWQWRPLDGLVWEVEHEVGRALLYGGFAFGWTLVLVTTFVINHFDLFGLRQTWRAFRGQPQAPVRFVTPVLYRISRSWWSPKRTVAIWPDEPTRRTPAIAATVEGCRVGGGRKRHPAAGHSVTRAEPRGQPPSPSASTQS